MAQARASITLPADKLPLPFKRIRDEVFVRVLIADSGGQRVAVVIADAPMFQAEVGKRLRARIATRLRIDPAHVLLGVSHTHNNVRADPNPGGIILPGSPIFVELFESATMAAVEQAAGRMRPARLAVGNGRVALVGSKNAWSPRHQRVIEAIDRTGSEPVNERLGVLRFDGLDGKPIAVLLNYGINPVVAMPLKDAISGDVPGAAARYVEARLGGDAVALFTLGAAGNPRYRADSGEAYGSPDPDALLQAMGTIIGEEALAAARAAEPASGLSDAGRPHGVTDLSGQDHHPAQPARSLRARTGLVAACLHFHRCPARSGDVADGRAADRPGGAGPVRRRHQRAGGDEAGTPLAAGQHLDGLA